MVSILKVIIGFTIMISGCNLSPLLFSLFINKLGHQLNSTGCGVDLGPINISAVFFADDIALFGKSSAALEKLMGITRSFFFTHHLVLSESKSKVMKYDARTEKMTFLGSSDFSSISLEEVVSFKYLGIHLSCSPYSLFKTYNEQVKKKARNYMQSVLSMARSGPDRSELAHALWSRCALPSILYGCEIMPLNQGTISEVERCQSLVGKFILQLPRNSTNVVANLDAGLKPVLFIIAERVIKYSSNLMKKPSSYWPKIALTENLNLGSGNPYTKYLMKMKSATNCYGVGLSQIRKNVDSAAIVSVLDSQRTSCVSSFAINMTKGVWFRPKAWVNDSPLSKILSEFRSCNSSLGNRGPTKDGRFFKLCPLCEAKGVFACNNEVRSLQ